MKVLLLLLILTVGAIANDITIDAAADRQPISPYIFGRNNSLSDNASSPVSKADWQKYRDAGVRIFRENGGNNSTKYNWEKKLTSHPDWYNNVYDHNWDYAAQSLQANMPGAQGMWAFQLIGWAASNKNNNFNDWGYNKSQWWEGVRNNWAGGGGPDKGDGDPEKYLEEWPADKTVGILDHWFNTLGLDSKQFFYWNMDNEVEIWNGTHDDVMPEQIGAEEFMQRYFDVAKKARAAFPDIKLVGPVPANEWQWYNWNNDAVTYNGRRYVWLEYFILRVAEEQQASGVRLLDVLDIHFYPGENNASDIVNLHRIWFDKKYTYPGANGVKRIGGGWNDALRQEYVFQRCNDWLEKYMGEDHGVGLGVSEMDINSNNPNLIAVWYASTLGVFADEGVELFTPWSWKTGMWEVLHLFSNNTKELKVGSSTMPADVVNAYASSNAAGDSLTVFLVNRDTNNSQDVNMSLANFDIADGDYTTLQLSNLPSNETFKSASDNALKTGSVSVANGALALSVPKLSITAILLTGKTVDSVVEEKAVPTDFKLVAYPNPFNPRTTISYSLPVAQHISIDIFDALGRRAYSVQNEFKTAGSHTFQFDGTDLASGVYLVRLSAGSRILTKKIMLMK